MFTYTERILAVALCTIVFTAAAVAGGGPVSNLGGAMGGPGADGGPAFAPAFGGAGLESGPLFFTTLGGSGATALRLFNQGAAAGTVTLTLYDTATGTLLGTYTSASIPVSGALELTAAQIAAGASPALTAAQLAAPYNASATATFHGTIDAIAATASAIVDESACGRMSGELGYVEGPGYPGVTGAVRLSNPSDTAGTITLTLKDAATGAQVGSWTSASVPAHGAVTVTTAAIAAASSPVVVATTRALDIFAASTTAHLKIEHIALVSGATVPSNLTDACAIGAFHP